MSLINPCIEPGCSTLCIGLFCVEHEAKPTVEFPRGRPWPPVDDVGTALLKAAPMLAPAEPVLTSVRPAA